MVFCVTFSVGWSLNYSSFPRRFAFQDTIRLDDSTREIELKCVIILAEPALLWAASMGSKVVIVQQWSISFSLSHKAFKWISGMFWNIYACMWMWVSLGFQCIYWTFNMVQTHSIPRGVARLWLCLHTANYAAGVKGRQYPVKNSQ